MAPVSPDPASPRACGLPQATADLLAEAGFGIGARLPIDRYDALVPEPWHSASVLPGARSAFVLGTGGGRFEMRWLAGAEGGVDAGAGAGPRGGEDPADALARAVCERAARSLEAETGEPARTWIYADRLPLSQGARVFADFVALAETAGLGTRSPLGLLLHRDLGPWWSVRAVILTGFVPEDAAPGGEAAPEPPSAPCRDCPAPCVEACPAGAVDLRGFDGEACATRRLQGAPCDTGCAARRACVLGPESAYPEAARVHYAAASLAWIRAARTGREEIP